MVRPGTDTSDTKPSLQASQLPADSDLEVQGKNLADSPAVGVAQERVSTVVDKIANEAVSAKDDVKDVFADTAAAQNLPQSEDDVKDAATKVAEMLQKAFVPTALFEEYLGTAATLLSRTGIQARDGGSVLFPGDKGDLKTLREGRVKILAQRLTQRLDRHVKGDTSGFETDMTTEATSLASIPFGAPLLHIIGHIYQEAASPWLGSAVGTFFKRVAHKAGTGTSALVGKVNLGLMKVDISVAKMSAVQQLKYLEERLGGAITHLWNVLTAEMESELREVTDHVLKKGSAPNETLVARAKALHILADIFIAAEPPKSYLDAPAPKKDPIKQEDIQNAAVKAASKTSEYFDSKGQPVVAALAGAAGEVASGEPPALFMHGAAAVAGTSDAVGEALDDAGPRIRGGIKQAGHQTRGAIREGADRANEELDAQDAKGAGAAAANMSPSEAIDGTLEQIGRVAPGTKDTLDKARPAVSRAQEEVAGPVVSALQDKQPQLEELTNELGRQAVVISKAVKKAYNEPDSAEDHLAAAAETVKDGLIDHKDAAADVMEAVAASAKPAADSAADIAKDVDRKKYGSQAKDTAGQVKTAADKVQAVAGQIRDADADHLKKAGHDAIRKGHGMAGQGREQGQELLNQAQQAGDDLASQADGQAGGAAGNARGKTDRVGQKGQEVADAAAEKGQDVLDTAAGGAKRTADQAAKDGQGVADTVNQGGQRLSKIAGETAQDMSKIVDERGGELHGKVSKIADDTQSGLENFRVLGNDTLDKAGEFADRGHKEIVKPAAKNFGDAAPDVGEAFGEKVIKPMGGRVAEDAVPAAEAVASDVQKAGTLVAEKAVPVTEDYTENLLKPTAKWATNTLQLQARAVAKEAGPLAEGLPLSLRKAVKLHRVPQELMPDILHLADLFEPLVAQVKEVTAKLPAAAEVVAKHAEPAADAISQAAVDTAHDVSRNAKPIADSTADTLISTAKEVEKQAPRQADATAAGLKAGLTEAGVQLKQGVGAEEAPAPRRHEA